MLVSEASYIRALDLGPELSRSAIHLTGNVLRDKPSGAVVAGSLVAFAPGVSELHQTDALQSLLLAQLAANAKAERHRDPVAWFEAYRSILEQTAWVVSESSAPTRYSPRVVKFTPATVVNDAFRSRVVPEELQHVMAAVNAYRADVQGVSQIVFECPSHSGGIGNFQVVLAVEEDAVLSLHIVQISFNAPQHVIRLMTEEFTNTAKFQLAFLSLTQNEQVYEKLRNAIASKLGNRFPSSVAFLELP